MSLSSRCTFDTNILFYAIDSSAGEKHRAAKQMLTLANRNNAFIILQTLGELFHSIHRKHPQRLPVARDFIDSSIELFSTSSLPMLKISKKHWPSSSSTVSSSGMP